MTLGRTTSTHERREVNMMRNTLDTLLKVMTQNTGNKSCIKQYFDYKAKLSKKLLKMSKEKILKHNVDKYFLVIDHLKSFLRFSKGKQIQIPK